MKKRGHHRRNKSVGGAFEAIREGAVFENFLLVGLGPNSQDTPEILYRFPPEKKLPFEQIDQFCFPEGVATRQINRTKSLSGFNSVVFGSLSQIETSERSFIFLLNTGEEVHYGVCVHNREFNSSLPSFMASASPNVLKHRAARASNRCYCLISRFPFFECHFNVLYAIIAAERHHSVMECLTWTESLDQLLSEEDGEKEKENPNKEKEKKGKEKVAQKKEEKTEEKKNVSFGGNSNSLTISSSPCPLNSTSKINGEKKGYCPKVSFQEQRQRSLTVQSSESRSIIRSYYALDVPSIGQNLSVTLPGEIPCNLSFPSEKEDGLLTDWTIPILCKSMSLENLVSFFTALLLEIQVIFVGNDLGLVSSIVLSAMPLLKPFIWQGPLLPLLPSTLSEFLFSPIPLITGVRSLPIEFVQDSAIDDYLIITLHENHFVPFRYPKNKIPDLPLKQKLISILGPHYHQINPSNAPLFPLSSRTKNRDQERNAARRLMSILRVFKSNIVSTIGNEVHNKQNVKTASSPTPKSNRGTLSLTRHLVSKKHLLTSAPTRTKSSPPQSLCREEKEKKEKEKKEKKEKGEKGEKGEKEDWEEEDLHFQIEGNVKKFLRTVAKEEKDFWAKFVATQQFTVFSEHLDDNFIDEKAAVNKLESSHEHLLEKEKQTLTTIREVIEEQQRQMIECEERIEKLNSELQVLQSKNPFFTPGKPSSFISFL